MLRKLTVTAAALLATTALALPAGASAEIVPVDDAPPATLLLPYFEIDLGAPNGGLIEAGGQPAQQDQADKDGDKQKGKDKGKDGDKGKGKGKNKGKGKDGDEKDD